MKTQITTTNSGGAALANLQDLQQAAIGFIGRSRAANTAKAYDADWQDFESWAAAHGVETRPAKPESVVMYVTHLATSGRRVATIERRLVTISQRHEAEGYDSPTRSLLVRTTMKGIRRSAQDQEHADKRGGRKTPVMTEHLKDWINGLTGQPIDTRNKAMILLGFAGAFRRSELIALNINDLEFSSDGVTVTIRKSKTDQEGLGRKVAIPFGTYPQTCPVIALQAWLKLARIESGPVPVFRSIHRGGKISDKRLDDRMVAITVKAAAKRLGLNPDDFGGHSLRAGHVTQAIKGGATELNTMRQTGHKSVNIFRGYYRDADLFTNNSAANLGL